jgi:hypothetical protein
MDSKFKGSQAFGLLGDPYAVAWQIGEKWHTINAHKSGWNRQKWARHAVKDA